jgi:hypothetical protein
MHFDNSIMLLMFLLLDITLILVQKSQKVDNFEEFSFVNDDFENWILVIFQNLVPFRLYQKNNWKFHFKNPKLFIIKDFITFSLM